MSLKYLTQLLKVDDLTLIDHLKKVLIRHYGLSNVVFDEDNYIFCIGDASRLCLVAHVDTVRRTIDEPVEVVRLGKNILKNFNGILGGDDRAGIYAIIYILNKCVNENIPKPNILITNFEECGGLGMIQFIEDMNNPDIEMDRVKNTFERTNLIIALDRCGKLQYVTYSPLHNNVRRYVEGFGFVSHRGIWSDILHLSRDMRIPSINLSIGYHNQHNPKEILRLDHMLMTISRVVEMIKNPIKEQYKITDRDLQKEYERLLKAEKRVRKLWLEKEDQNSNLLQKLSNQELVVH